MGVLHHIETFWSTWSNTFAISRRVNYRLQRIADLVRDWPKYYYFILVEDVMIFLACKRQIIALGVTIYSLFIWPFLSKEITICLVTYRKHSNRSRDLKY